MVSSSDSITLAEMSANETSAGLEQEKEKAVSEAARKAMMGRVLFMEGLMIKNGIVCLTKISFFPLIGKSARECYICTRNSGGTGPLKSG